MKKLTKLLALLLTVMLVLPAASALADTSWPEKTLKIIVPYKAGGDTDFHTRKLAEYLEPILGQTIVVENIEGASGSIGMMEVMNAKPDGYTMLYFHESMLTNNVTEICEYTHNDLDVCAASVVDDSYVLVVGSQTPYMTLDDLVAAAKENPGDIAFAASSGGYSYYIGRLLEETTGIDLNVCDAGGTGARNSAVLSGKMQVTAHVYGGLKPYIDSGEFRVLAALGEERNELFPDIPTAREQGYDMVGGRAYFLSFPKGTDPEIIAKMSAAIEEVCQNEQFIKETQEAYMTTPSYLNTEDLQARLDANLAFFWDNVTLLVEE
ncbi:MAG: tripartite tricarboxylate transporter substrate binding protein [Clostridia bacterium]|nr:tripartite tricarboxylate transporter substrate binding protein [Clostridia bacterium]